MPTCGYLYQDQYIKLINCDGIDALRNILAFYPQYRNILEGVPDPTKARRGEDNREAMKHDNGGLDQAIFKAEVAESIMIFDEQANYAAFYAFMVLKEQEYRNIGWVASMIGFSAGKSDPRWDRIVFPMESREI